MLVSTHHGINAISGRHIVKIGGKDYHWVKIGTQIWLAENLDYVFSGCNFNPSGTPSTPACWYYGLGDAAPIEHLGLLYNWYAVSLLESNKSTLIPGWRVPTVTDFNTLIAYTNGSSNMGATLRAPTVWTLNVVGTNNYGFSSLPAGYKGLSYCDSLYTNTYTWSLTDQVGGAYCLSISSGGAITYVNDSKLRGFSVRLIKDI